MAGPWDHRDQEGSLWLHVEDPLWGRGTPEESTALFQAHPGRQQHGEKWSDLGHIFKVEPAGFLS